MSASIFCRRGGAVQSFSHSTAELEREGHGDADTDAGGGGAEPQERGAGAEDAWVPDQETGVFVPADETSGDGDGKNRINGADGGGARGQAGPSVLDQAVFVREEDMEDVERPAVGTVDVADADASAK
ncbi:unnamed protein product [Miscanthus lutarioriparius]|uniref:Uncharacterized protein n=1 Tax=Miscanthus lutarioriparius TaxID=422564 RepID=A0A811SCU9_9POAL|nr:unnamed protein product [Miscanthus lutarioriparius]